MKELVPNFSNVKSLQDLSKVLAFPMIMASWILQTGMQIDAGNMGSVSLPEGGSQVVLITMFLLIFIGKGLWASVIGGLVYAIVSLADHYTNSDWMLVAAAFFLAFGIYGIAGGAEIVANTGLIPLWFYTSIVYAFFLHSSHSEMSR
ncbi:hypothetical protein [Ectothiorhodospira mobilis]|uniref:hypothetical protein n=1 Tax=Ectothiorhodospira mobilis TaxID=195064 RepID=UPI000B812448|nr:hypothetical protein [Ectothiorhodospira mobilis]